MPTYLYETIPPDDAAQARRFELRQGFHEPPLTYDPETGAPVRRVISGGLATMLKSAASSPDAGSSCGPASCGCGKFN